MTSFNLFIAESAMADVHMDIGDMLDKHINKYYAGQTGHDQFGSKVLDAHKKIAKMHGIEHKDAVKLVNNYVDDAIARKMKAKKEVMGEAKATQCGRCGTTHVPPSKGGTCPALKEEADLAEGIESEHFAELKKHQKSGYKITGSNDAPHGLMSTTMKRSDGKTITVTTARKDASGYEHSVKEEVGQGVAEELINFVNGGAPLNEASGIYTSKIQGGSGKGKAFGHKSTTVDDHLSAMKYHLAAYHKAKSDGREDDAIHHGNRYYNHKEQIDRLGDVGEYRKEERELNEISSETLMAYMQRVSEGSNNWHPSSTVKNPNFNDELSIRRVSPPGRRLKSGKLSADERGSQERTKALMKYTMNKGGLTGPKGPLPEENAVEEGYDDYKRAFKRRELEHELRHEEPARPRYSRGPSYEPARIYHKVPYAQKDDAKKEGMKWDGDKKKWYHTTSQASNISKFQKENVDMMSQYVAAIDQKTNLITPLDEQVSVKKHDSTVTIRHGMDVSYHLCSDHRAAINKLQEGQASSFVDGDNRTIYVVREGDLIHLSSSPHSKKTSFDRSHLVEAVRELPDSLVNTLSEKMLTPAEKKKREEVAQAIERDDPSMPMSKKMAIATATAKRVAEATSYVAHTIRNGQMGPKIKISALDSENAEFQAKQMVGRPPYRGYSLHKVEKVSPSGVAKS